MKDLKLFRSKVCFDDYYENKDPRLLYDCWLDADCRGWNGWLCLTWKEMSSIDSVKRCINDTEHPDGAMEVMAISLTKSCALNRKK